MEKLLAYQVYLKKGQSDLKVSRKLLDDNEIEADIICFHLQQFIEKYLKAFILSKNIQPKKSHDLSFLLNECLKIDNDFDIFTNSIITEFTDCGVIIRYDEVDSVDRSFIHEAIPSILEFKEFIDKKIQHKLI